MAKGTADFEQQLRNANEELYKHSHDLAVRNKTLSLLRQLYEFGIQTVDPQLLATEMADTLRTALELEMVGLMSYEKPTDSFDSLVFSMSDRVQEASNKAHYSFSELVFENASKIPFLANAFIGSAASTKNISDLWESTGHADSVTKIAEEAHIRELLVEPLHISGKLQGILILGFNRPVEELSQFEQESLYSLVSVITIALDHAHLYEELRLANERQATLIHFITHQNKGFVAKSRNIFSMILEGDYGPVPDTMKPMLDEGFRSDTKGAQTIQEILNASNIKSGKVTYTMAPFDLKTLIEEIAEELKHAAETKGLELKLELGGEPLTVTGDRAQLVNAYKNIIDNSIKYTQKGSVTIALSKENNKTRFVVNDTGVGITPEDMKNLFTEGGHGKESAKINVDSTGFGLYIVKSIVEAHKGKVWAESDGEGKGSRFIIELPAYT